jgi:hypothetical protein
MANKFFIESCLAFIVFVTAVDIFWSVCLTDTLLECEENPVAAYVIELGDRLTTSGVALLCGMKVISTFLVVAICRMLYRRRSDIGVAVIVGVAVLQLWVLCYLYSG